MNRHRQMRGGCLRNICQQEETKPHTHRHTDTQTRRHTDTQTHRHTDTQTHRHTDTQTHRHTDTQTHRHRDTETHRHTDTQTQRHRDTHTHTHAPPECFPDQSRKAPPKYWSFSSTERRFSRTARRAYTPSSSRFCWTDETFFLMHWWDSGSKRRANPPAGTRVCLPPLYSAYKRFFFDP